MITKRVPVYFILPAMMLSVALTWVFLSGAKGHSSQEHVMPGPDTIQAAQITAEERGGAYRMRRMPGFQLTHPLLYSEPEGPSSRYAGMRDILAAVIDRAKRNGSVRSASVYVRDFERSEWTGVNLDETFDPGSMLKMSLMMHWLERATHDPDLLDQRILCTPIVDSRIPTQRIEGPHVQAGQRYTVRELLRYMIVFSDNNATYQLSRHMDGQRFAGLYEEMGLARPQQHSRRYPMSSRDISVFLKTLYNSTILTPPYSELALKLMSESTFNDGIRQGVPTDVVIAHKFGEAGTPEDIQLHEAAIVYAPDHPYLISVMTRGTDMTAQKALIAQLSASAYNLLVATGTVPRASKEGGSKARSHNPVGP